MARYITLTLKFDRAAILRGAWAKARALVKSLADAPAPFHRITTARAVFGQCMRDVWATARSERALAIWAAEQQAGAAMEAARRGALPAPGRALEDATAALTLAEHADRFTAVGNVALIAARARLAALHPAA